VRANKTDERGSNGRMLDREEAKQARGFADRNDIQTAIDKKQLFACPIVVGAARLRGNWLLGLTKDGGVLRGRGWVPTAGFGGFSGFRGCGTGIRGGSPKSDWHWTNSSHFGSQARWVKIFL